MTTDSNYKEPVGDKLLNREFTPGARNQAWTTDITYIWTLQRRVYLAVVLDLYSRRIVGRSIDRQMKIVLVTRALMMAINLRNPAPVLWLTGNIYPTREAAVVDVRAYVDYYNSRRLQATLGGKKPIDMEIVLKKVSSLD